MIIGKTNFLDIQVRIPPPFMWLVYGFSGSDLLLLKLYWGLKGIYFAGFHGIFLRFLVLKVFKYYYNCYFTKKKLWHVSQLILIKFVLFYFFGNVSKHSVEINDWRHQINQRHILWSLSHVVELYPLRNIFVYRHANFALQKTTITIKRKKNTFDRSRKDSRW